MGTKLTHYLRFIPLPAFVIVGLLGRALAQWEISESSRARKKQGSQRQPAAEHRNGADASSGLCDNVAEKRGSFGR